MTDLTMVASLIATLKVPVVAQLVNANLEEKIASLHAIIEKKNDQIQKIETKLEL